VFARPDRTEKLFAAVNEGQIPLSDVPRDRLTIAANSRSATVKAQALEFLRVTTGPARQETLAKYASALQRAGDLERGRQVFTKHCASCHRVEGKGHEIGPNLATIKSRGPDSILVNVLDPNAEVNPQYVNYVVLTVDGRTMTGMIASENANSITLQRAEAATDTVLRSDVERLQSTGKSIMPEGLEESIDVQSMADLISYLMQVN
jgi:putative heme-binding domain-containing protein